jgi:hypothetical protein
MCPNEPSRSVTVQSVAEELVVQHALTLYRDTKALAKNAAPGQFLNCAEAAIVDKGREFLKTSLQTIVQEEIDDVEKKKDTRLCPMCQTQKRHRGRPTKQIETATGTITLKRRYDECMPCRLLEHAADALVGLQDRFTIGLRSLACYAGAGKSYDGATKDLKFYRGLNISHMTIRELCNEEAPKMEKWIRESTEVQAEFVAAPGNVEVTIDGTCVNTTEGAREVKVGIISKRKRGQGVPPERWGNRNKQELPEVETNVAFAAVGECGEFQKEVNYWRHQLRLGSTSDISALGDGAAWIWSLIFLVFGKVRECLDVYHALEHLSDTGKVLYGEGTAEYKQWYEETTMELLKDGFELIEKRLEDLEREKRTDKEKESLRLLRGYLGNNRDRLCYALRLAEGRAIGSGQVEGACKHLIGARLKQTWAKWLVPRLNRMAVLCSIRYCKQWEKYWQQAK